MSLENLLYEHADYCLRVSIYCTGKVMQKKLTAFDQTIMKVMIKECKPASVWARKSNDYKWSESDGFTKWLYDNVLKYFKIDPDKGLNGDQLRAYFAYIHATKNVDAAKRIWLGFKLRFGFYPSLMENCIFKPQAMVLLFDLLKNESLLLKILAKVSKFFFMRSMEKNLNIPLEESTTDKITMLPTMKLLGLPLPDRYYIEKVYNTYFSGRDDESAMIRNSLINGLLE